MLGPARVFSATSHGHLRRTSLAINDDEDIGTILEDSKRFVQRLLLSRAGPRYDEERDPWDPASSDAQR